MTVYRGKRRLKLGFVGGGLSSAVGSTHFAASQLDGHWQLVAGVFGLDEEINQATAEAWHIPKERLYSTRQELITHEQGNLDAVVVLTPTPVHLEVVCDLLRAEIPVICEKALVSSLAQADTLKDLYDPTKHFLAVTYNYSGYPMMRELRQRIEDKEFGKIQQLHLEMPQEGFVRPPDIAGKSTPPQDWRLEDDIIPTICLDLGVHLHHLSNFLTDEEPSAVHAEFNTYSQYTEIVDNVKMWLRYDSGISASYWMSKTAIGRRNGLKIRVFGEKASAEWIQLDPEILRLAYIDGAQCIIDRGGPSKICSLHRYNRMKAGHPSGFIEAFANLYSDLADALIQWREKGRHTNPYVFGFDHALRGLFLFHAARNAHENKAWITLNDQANEYGQIRSIH